MLTHDGFFKNSVAGPNLLNKWPNLSWSYHTPSPPPPCPCADFFYVGDTNTLFSLSLCVDVLYTCKNYLISVRSYLYADIYAHIHTQRSSLQYCICVHTSYGYEIVSRVVISYDITILRHDITPIADSVPQNFEIISESLPTNQNSARGIYD